MRIQIAFLLAAAVAGAVAAAPAPAAAKKPKRSTYVYAYRSSSPVGVLAYRWERDGTLSQVEGSPFLPEIDPSNCGGFCGLLGYSKKRQALITPGGHAISVFLIGDDGKLSVAPGSPLAVDGVTNRLFGTRAVDRAARTFVYTSDYGGDAIRGWEMAADGSLTVLPQSPFPTGGSGPDGLAATSRHVFAINEDGGLISAFTVEQDGALTPAPGPLADMGTDQAWNVHVDPRGKRVYAGAGGEARLFGFAIRKKTGELSPLKGSPFPSTITSVGSGPSFGKKGPAVLVGESSGGVESAEVARNGAITPIPDTIDTTMTRIQAHGRSPNGKHLVLVGNGDRGSGLYTFAVNRKTGLLTLVDFVADAVTGVSGLQVVQR